MAQNKNDKKAVPPTPENTRKNERDVIAALDIGSSKVCCFIAETGAHGGLDVIGIGHQAARGVKSGKITDLKAAEHAIGYAVEAAENMARARLQNRPISSVYVSVPGTQALSHQMDVDARVTNGIVTDRDVRNALSHARAAGAHGRDNLIHVIPGNFTLDRQRGIADPRGMKGQQIGVHISAVTAYTTALRNISHVAAQNHLDIEGYCAAPYAAGLSCLVDDEKDLGCTVIDMGGGTTSIAVFAEGRLIFTAAIPVGGQHVTSDIARGLTTSLADAERIKTLYGSAQTSPADDAATIDVPPVGEEEHALPNYVPKSLLTGIIQPRIEETFELVRAKLVDSGIDAKTGRRVVLTGGASQLSGLTDIAQLILDKQVRLGRPQKMRGLAEATGGPAFSACAGLLHYAVAHADEVPVFEKPQNFVFNVPIGGPLLQKVTLWLKENW